MNGTGLPNAHYDYHFGVLPENLLHPFRHFRSILSVTTFRNTLPHIDAVVQGIIQEKLNSVSPEMHNFVQMDP